MASITGINFVDIIILVIFALSIIIGFWRGFVSEVISLLILIAAFAVAIYFTTPLANYFTTAASSEGTTQSASYVALAISFTLLFMATIIVGIIIKALLNLALSAAGIGIGNRIMGGLFGLVRGFLINLVIIFLVQLSPLTNESWWQNAKYVPHFQPAVDWLGKVISPALADLKFKFGSSTENETETKTNNKTEMKTE